MVRRHLYAGNNRYSIAAACALAIVALIALQNQFLTAAYVLSGLALIAFGVRRLRRVDRDAAKVEDAWRFYWLVPLRVRAQHPLSQFDRVELRLEYRRRGGRHHKKLTYYLIDLKGKKGQTQRIKEWRKYLKSRRFAERLARLAQLPLHDRTTGSRQVRRPEDLDLNLRERLRRSSEAIERPQLPQGSTIRVKERGRSIHLQMPPQATSIPLIVGAVTLTQVFTLAGWFIWKSKEAPFGLLFIGVGIFAGLTFLNNGLLSRWPIKVSIEVEQIKIKQGWHRIRIKNELLEEIVFGRHNLYFIGDRVMKTFPYDFHSRKQKAEARFLRDMMEYALRR